MEYETRVLNDSIYKWRKLQVIEDLKVKYETDKKNGLIAKLDLERIAQTSVIIKNRTFFLLSGVFFALSVALALVYYRKREKYHRKIKGLESAEKVREERDRIARELHDSLGGQLSSISIGLSRVNTGTERSVIETVQEIADRAMHELRDSLWVLNKETIAIEEIEQRINTLFWQYRKIEIPIRLELEVEPKFSSLSLPSATAGHLYRIVQEAVSNAIKHSQASYLKVAMKEEAHSLLVKIKDDGVGFDLTIPNTSEHFGLANMRKRADAIKAQFSIASSEGVQISLHLSLDKLS